MITEIELEQQIEHHRKWARFYDKQIQLVTEDLANLTKIAQKHHDQLKESKQKLTFLKMPMPTGTDWFRTVPLGKISLIMDKYGCIWCPSCEGSGRKREKSLFRKEILCSRCNGKMIIPIDAITEDEFKHLTPFEQGEVYKTSKYKFYNGWSRYYDANSYLNLGEIE